MKWSLTQILGGQCQYDSIRPFKDIYDMDVNVKRLMKEKNEFYNEQQGNKRNRDQQENHHSQNPYKKPQEK